MERKKRVTRLGRYDDLEFCDIYKVGNCAKGSSSYDLELPSVKTKPVMTSSQRKFVPSKRHLLMEKVQKNISYIKHNRSVPKPRAHLGGFRSTGQQQKESRLVQNSSPSLVKVKSKDYTTQKLQPKKPACHEDSLAKKSDTSSVKPTLSDSDSEFESFVQTQKQDMGYEPKSSAVKRKKRGRKSGKKLKVASLKTGNGSVSVLKSVGLESSDDEVSKKPACHDDSLAKKSDTSTVKATLSDSEFESFVQTQKQDMGNEPKSSAVKRKKGGGKSGKKLKVASLKTGKGSVSDLKSVGLNSSDDEVSVRCLRKRKSNTISCKVTNTNKILLPETSDSSDEPSNENKGEDFSEVRTEHSLLAQSPKKGIEFEVEASKLPEIKSCSVRIERDPDIEKTVCQLGLQSQKSDSQNEEVCSKLSENVKADFVDEEDEILIVCEIPKSDVCSNKLITELRDESEIQILNVVSLTGSEEGIVPKHAVSKSTAASLLENVNFDKLKQALDIAYSKDSSCVTNTMTDILVSSTSHEFNKENSPTTADILKAVGEIDFKKIISLTTEKSQQNQFNSLPCKSISEEVSSYTRLSAPIAENQKVDKNIAGDIFMSPQPSTSTNKLKLSSSDLKDILSNVEKMENTSLRQPIGNTLVQNHIVEDPREELDAITAAAIRHPNCDDENKEILLKLVSELINIHKLYIEIKSNGELTEGLLVLQQLISEKERHLETVVENIMRQDPCVYKVLEDSGPTVLNPNSISNSIGNSENISNSSLELPKICVRCGLKATIDCARCKKVYFCSENCGVFYWNNFHYKECYGIRREEWS